MKYRATVMQGETKGERCDCPYSSTGRRCKRKGVVWVDYGYGGPRAIKALCRQHAKVEAGFTE